MRRAVAALLLVGAASPLAAQRAPDQVALGVAAAKARAPWRAFAHFRAAVAADSANCEANWRAAMALVDLGQRTADSVKSARRDSLYAEAEAYARRAVAADSGRADAHFALAVAIGRASLSRRGKKERLRRAAEVREEALRAIALDPRHDGAYHVLGRWNAEVMRLSGLSRFFAKSFLGGAVLGQASWQHAIDYMRRAVRLDPRRIYHHLDLGEIYIRRKRWAEARAELAAARALPVSDFMDPVYKREADRLLREIAGKR